MAGMVMLFSTVMWAQLRPKGEGRIVLDTVRAISGVPDTVLYERAKEWMLRNLKSADNQVSLDDKVKEKLIGTTNLLLPDKKENAFSYSSERVLNFKLSVFVKNGRYRVMIENIVYSEVVETYYLDGHNERRPGMISMEAIVEKKSMPRANGKPSKANKFDEATIEFNKEIDDQVSSLHTAMIGNTGSEESGW